MQPVGNLARAGQSDHAISPSRTAAAQGPQVFSCRPGAAPPAIDAACRVRPWMAQAVVGVAGARLHVCSAGSGRALLHGDRYHHGRSGSWRLPCPQLAVQNDAVVLRSGEQYFNRGGDFAVQSNALVPPLDVHPASPAYLPLAVCECRHGLLVELVRLPREAGPLQSSDLSGRVCHRSGSCACSGLHVHARGLCVAHVPHHFFGAGGFPSI